MTKHLHKYFSYEEASIMAQEAGINTVVEYQDWARGIKGLPSTPNAIYPEWTNWIAFLKGKDVKRKCTLDEAIAINKKFGIKNYIAYQKLCHTLQELPKEPRCFYRDKWCGTRVFFGAEPGETLNYEDASNLLKELGITSRNKYCELADVDERFPLTAEVYYKDSWEGWDKFLQKPEKIKLYSYEEAKAFLKGLGIVSSTQYMKEYRKYPRLPSTPYKKYKEWIDWRNFLD